MRESRELYGFLCRTERTNLDADVAALSVAGDRCFYCGRTIRGRP